MNSLVNQFYLNRYRPVLGKVNALKDAMASLGDEELHAQTDVLRERLSNGESDKAILPAAFAAMRENMKRKIASIKSVISSLTNQVVK